MPNLFEREGHTLWVRLRDHVGAPLPEELRTPKPAPDQRELARREAARQERQRQAEEAALAQTELAERRRQAHIAAAERIAAARKR